MAAAQTIEEVHAPRSLREYQLVNDRRVGGLERSVAEIRAHVEPIAEMGPTLREIVAIRQREIQMAEARTEWIKRGGKVVGVCGGLLNGLYIVGKIAGWWG
jgi:hypothetical protein